MWERVTALLDAMMGPLFRLMAPLSPVWQGVLLGLPVALLALLVYRVASNQAAIASTKDGIKANLYALLLFRDDLRVVLKAQGHMFLLVGRYLRLGLVPLAILFVPVVLLLAQIEARFAYRPIEVGRPVLLTVVVDDSREAARVNAVLTGSPAMRIETPAFRLASEHSVTWRLSAAASGEQSVTVQLGDRSMSRAIWAGDTRPETLVASIYRAGDIMTLGSPGEAAIPGEIGISKILVEYQPAQGVLAGLSSASWSMFISSLVFGLVLRRPMRVEF